MPVCDICGYAFEGDTCPQCDVLANQVTTTFAPVTEPGAGVPDRTQNAVKDEGTQQPASMKSVIKKAALRVIKGPQIGDDFSLRSDETTIGRNPKADIFLNDRTVSREQARIVHIGGVYILSDLGSLNGTYVNRKLVDEAELLHGDVVQFGTFQMQFHQD